MKKFRDGGIYTAGMGQPPQDIDGGSAPPKKKPAPKAPAPKKPAAKTSTVKKYENGGYLQTEDGKRVKDGSNQDIMTGYGREEAETQARMESARKKLEDEVQDMVKAKPPAAAQSNKASDGDVDERDRRMEAAASAPSRMPARPGQSAPKASAAKAPVKAKASTASAAPVSRARATPAGSAPKQTTGSTYSNEGRGRPAPAAPERRAGTALPINPALLRQRDADEKRRDAARAAKRAADEAEKKARPAKEAAERKMLSEQAGAVSYRKKREEQEKMSPGQRSAARGKAVKEFFGMAKGGSTSSASKRADGIATKGKTRGKVY